MAHFPAYTVLRHLELSKLIAGAFQQLRRLSSAASDAVDADAVVIGAGVVGLAVARQLALAGRSVMLLEKAGAIGTETSSRNSEVIHAGIYYPPGSLKAQLCVRGKHLLYDFCEQYGVPHRRLGKLVVAKSEAQVDALHTLAAQGAANGVRDLQLLTAQQVAELEPAVRCVAGMLSPSTGIIDGHSLMEELLRQFEEAGGTTALYSRVEGGDVVGSVKRLSVRDMTSGELVELRAGAVVNAAGLHAQAVASRLRGTPPDSIPPLHLAKGSYFTLAPGALATIAAGSSWKGSHGRAAAFRHLVYPMPEPGTAGLGTHLTRDLAGGIRFGPDVEWLPPGTKPEAIDYTVSAERAKPFYSAIRSYLPGLPDGSLQPSYSGVRPKVSGQGQPAGDFVLQGLMLGSQTVHLYGIESPGLTASLGIAECVATLLSSPSSGD